MRVIAAPLTIAAVLGLGCSRGTEVSAPLSGTPQETFKASDAKPVFADLYRSKGKANVVVLMFHQAGSNAGEYETIAPKVAARGLDCLAVDQRSGGDMWGRTNRTAKSGGDGKDYLAAYGDLVGAVDWAKSKGYRHIVAWGSSYSASLALRLASERPEVEAVLSFSPGEYMDDKNVVKSWASRVKVPLLVASTGDEWKDQAQSIFFAAPVTDKVSIATENGIHGSSTLIPDRNAKGNVEYWKALDAFLDKLIRSWAKESAGR